MNRPLLLCLLLTLLLISPTLMTAQGDAGWPVVERCLSEPTAPPEGWTFDGTILMAGSFGIHAITSDSAIPYVVSFIDDSEEKIARGSPGLSPDGHWYAVLEGQTSFGQAGSTDSVTGIRAYSTVVPRQSYYVPWENTEFVSRSGSIRYAYWIDNEHIAYYSDTLPDGMAVGGRFKINPFSGEVQNFPPNRWRRHIYPAPDWSRFVEDIADFAPTEFVVTDDQNEILVSLGASRAAAPPGWMHDSSHFAMAYWTPDYERQQLHLYDRDGTLVDSLFTAEPDRLIRLVDSSSGWSYDDRYLGFRLVGDDHRYGTLHVADRQMQTIVNLCTSVVNFVWSPDSYQMAIAPARTTSLETAVYVLDIEDNRLYTVGYHRFDLFDYTKVGSGIIGWRAN